MTNAALGSALVLGATLGLGLWSLVGALPSLRRPRLATRIAPHLVDISAEARAMAGRRPVEPLPLLGEFFAPPLRRGRMVLDAVLGGRDAIRTALTRSDSTLSLEAFRTQQLLGGVACTVVVLVAQMLLPAMRGLPVVSHLALPILAFAAGVVGRERILRHRATARTRRIEGELPTVLEFMTLSLSAGEGLHDAMRRVATVSSGETSREFSIVLTDVGLGGTLAEALAAMDARLGCRPVTRFVDQVVTALERGSPIVEVLRAQADDARSAAQRRLLDSAGRKEVGMMVPLVFLILPLTVCFAVFPGIVVLQTRF